jgi:hypothetical protein
MPERLAAVASQKIVAPDWAVCQPWQRPRDANADSRSRSGGSSKKNNVINMPRFGEFSGENHFWIDFSWTDPLATQGLMRTGMCLKLYQSCTGTHY